MGFGEWVLAAFRAQTGEFARLPRSRHDVPHHVPTCNQPVASLHIHARQQTTWKRSFNVGLIAKLKYNSNGTKNSRPPSPPTKDASFFRRDKQSVIA